MSKIKPAKEPNQERTKILALAQLLESFASQAISLRASPVPLLLETIIDLLLELKLTLKEETQSPRENEELVFLDFAKADEMGNSPQRRQKVLKKNPLPSTWYEPDAGPSIDQLVSLLIEVKKGKPVREAFMALLSKQTVPVLRTVSLHSPIETPKGAKKSANRTMYEKRKELARRKQRSRKRSK